MKNSLIKFISAVLLTVLTVLPGICYALQASDNTRTFEGYYARERNNGSPSKTLHCFDKNQGIYNISLYNTLAIQTGTNH